MEAHQQEPPCSGGRCTKGRGLRGRFEGTTLMGDQTKLWQGSAGTMHVERRREERGERREERGDRRGEERREKRGDRRRDETRGEERGERREERGEEKRGERREERGEGR
eukprot:623324-Hanusia_phi.AAC.1